MNRDVFQAIADPTRRKIINILSRHPLNLVSITGKFPITRTAVSKHLKILVECGVVEMKREGRVHTFKAKLRALKKVVTWAEQYKEFWNNKLDRLEDYLENEDENE